MVCTLLWGDRVACSWNVTCTVWGDTEWTKSMQTNKLKHFLKANRAWLAFNCSRRWLFILGLPMETVSGVQLVFDKHAVDMCNGVMAYMFIAAGRWVKCFFFQRLKICIQLLLEANLRRRLFYICKYSGSYRQTYFRKYHCIEFANGNWLQLSANEVIKSKCDL